MAPTGHAQGIPSCCRSPELAATHPALLLCTSWQQTTELSPPHSHSHGLLLAGFANPRPHQHKAHSANCTKSSNKSNAIPPPSFYCSRRAPVTTICGKILHTSTLARVSSSASEQTALKSQLCHRSHKHNQKSHYTQTL